MWGLWRLPAALSVLPLPLRSTPGSGNSGAAGGPQSLSELAEGQLLSGRVRRVERYGVFVEVRCDACGPRPQPVHGRPD